MKTHKWSDVRRRRTPDEEARIDEAKAMMRHEMRLADIRQARGLTQATIAKIMRVGQGEVSKLERRSDLYLSTLRDFLLAMNAELVLVARFPDGDVNVSLSDGDESQPTGARPRRTARA